MMNSYVNLLRYDLTDELFIKHCFIHKQKFYLNIKVHVVKIKPIKEKVFYCLFSKIKVQILLKLLVTV